MVCKCGGFDLQTLQNECSKDIDKRTMEKYENYVARKEYAWLLNKLISRSKPRWIHVDLKYRGSFQTKKYYFRIVDTPFKEENYFEFPTDSAILVVSAK